MRRNVKFTLVLGLLVGCAVAVFADTKKAQDIDAEQKKFRELADVALREGKWETAIKMYTQSLLLRPNWSDYFKRATAYSAGVNTAFAAFSDLSNALKEKPDLNQARSRRAKLGLTLGLLDQAKQDYEYLRTATPNDDTVQPQLHLIAQLEQQIIHAKSLIQSKQWQFARDLLTQILESCPSSLELRLLRAEAFFNLGDFNSVSDDATRVWKLQGSNVAAQYWKGRAAFYLGDQDSAIKAFREALKSDPEDRMTKDEMKRVTKFTRALKAAEEHAAQRKWMEMIAEYQNLPAFEPLPSHYFQKVYLSLCKAQVALKNYDKALEECTKSVDNGGGWEALVERGQAHEDAQQYQKAVADYQHALELSNRQDVHQKLLNAQRLLKMAKRKDYYKILGVEKNAAQQEIKKAHRKLALQWHPDKHPADKKEEAQKVYTEITEAWEVLGDPEKRGKYDRGEDMEEQPMHHHHGGGFPFGFGGPGGPGGPGGFTFSFNFGGR